MYSRTFYFLISLLIVTTSHGQNTQLENQLDQLLAKQFKPAEPGCEVLIAKEGQVVYKKGFGSANIELNVRITPDMVFNLASITKQFTAVAILQLVEQNKISLQDSLQKFIADFPSKGYTITIENLLTHTSGIKDYMQLGYHPDLFMERRDFIPKQIIDSIKNYPLEFEPGTKFSYSNSGYYLLGYIIAKVSHQRYQEYVEEHILKPLGLNHSYYDSAGLIIPNRVNGYRIDGSAYKNAEYWSPTIGYAAGGLISNADDLFKWFEGLRSYKILNKEMLEKAFTPFKLKDGSLLNYGYGWYIENWSSIKSIEHSGKMSGFTTNEIYFPKQDVFIVALFNCEDAPKDNVSREIAEIVLGQTLQPEARLSDSLLNLYVGIYSLTTDPKRTIKIFKKDARLFAMISGQTTFEIVFQAATVFQLKDVRDMTGEFISENGIVVKMIVNQNGKFQWKKIN